MSVLFDATGSGPDQKERGLFGDGSPGRRMSTESHASGEDILALQDLDPAMNRKMHLVNNVSGKCDASQSHAADWPDYR